MIDPVLRQNGRASMDFLVSLAKANGKLGEKLRRDISAAGIVAEKLPDDLDKRDAVMTAALGGSDAFHLSTSLSDFMGKMHGEVARAAFVEILDRLSDELDELETRGLATLDTNPDLQTPDYYKDVWFHNTLGGWDGHPQQGYIHGELVHRGYVSKVFAGGDMFAQRHAVLRELPQKDFRHILELGTSAGHYTLAIQQAFPDAAITGLDLSVPMLRQALRVGNANGWSWRLLRRAAEHSGLPDDSFDLVTAYSFFHEMPERAIRDIYTEAMRVLKHGGMILFVDITPYAIQDKLSVWRADRAAMRGGEPYWRESASLDWAAMAQEAGFVQVRGRGVGERNFPWVVSGVKA